MQLCSVWMQDTCVWTVDVMQGCGSLSLHKATNNSKHGNFGDKRFSQPPQATGDTQTAQKTFDNANINLKGAARQLLRGGTFHGSGNAVQATCKMPHVML